MNRELLRTELSGDGELRFRYRAASPEKIAAEGRTVAELFAGALESFITRAPPLVQ